MSSRMCPHLCWQKFKWSWRYRLYIHYFDAGMSENRFVGIFKNDNNKFIGVNGCKNRTVGDI